jgi:hypothetical protein
MRALKYKLGQVLRLKPGGENDFSSIKLRNLIKAGDRCVVVKLDRLGGGVEATPNTPYTVKFQTARGPRLQGIKEKHLAPLSQSRDSISAIRKRVFEALHP